MSSTDNIGPVVIYNIIELTEEEIKAAIYEAKKIKYFKLKNADYWQELELRKKIKQKVTNI
jgi:hypothetical protein